ncbi:MAG: hypothetical protein Q9195_004303 [Heterodermia aff. obscurata]
MTIVDLPPATDDVGTPSEPAPAPRPGVLGADSARVANQLVVAKIESQVAAIAAELLLQEEISIVIRTKKAAARFAQADFECEAVEGLVQFPGRTARETWRFTVLLRILDLLHEALMNGAVVSKRNIYYQDPSLFKKQAGVDRYVDALAFTFRVQRANLNVTAAAKGLVIGNFRMIAENGTILHIDSQPGARLINDMYDQKAIDCSGVAWVLVVEKEAKGYPDLSSRAFLRLLSTPLDVGAVPPRIFVLADFDTDGIAIMSTYKHGSWNMSHENAQLNVPSIRWLGLRSRDLFNGTTDANDAESSRLLPLSKRDRSMAKKMLEKPAMRETGGEGEWRREVQVMMMIGFKAEMEMMDGCEGGIAKWTENRLIAELARL